MINSPLPRVSLGRPALAVKPAGRWLDGFSSEPEGSLPSRQAKWGISLAGVVLENLYKYFWIRAEVLQPGTSVHGSQPDVTQLLIESVWKWTHEAKAGFTSPSSNSTRLCEPEYCVFYVCVHLTVPALMSFAFCPTWTKTKKDFFSTTTPHAFPQLRRRKSIGLCWCNSYPRGFQRFLMADSWVSCS